jgi:hypothetical protein
MLNTNLSQVVINSDSNYHDRFSLCLNPEIRKGIEYCKRKFGFENYSMVVRRAIIAYLTANLSREELERLSE